jgi:hypothetical protein
MMVNDDAYYARRAQRERAAARAAASELIAHTHRELAREYERRSRLVSLSVVSLSWPAGSG